jgi:biopolymer transport protein TolR
MAFNTFSESDSVLSEINITPLVDVMLVLLVAFIVTAPLMSNAVKVNSDGQIFLDKRAISQETVESELVALKAQKPDLVLHLQADEVVPYGSVAKVMASIERAGITKLAVLTTPLQ